MYVEFSLLWYLSESMKREINNARQLLSSMLPKFVIEEMAANVSEVDACCVLKCTNAQRLDFSSDPFAER